ncbi:MAG: hypothetical protein GY765_26185 [bacterium]|nr:hypothetical protein [bacterium]
MKKLFIFALIVTMSLGLYANGLNLNGNGTKAISMGGAFIGLADDYSAVFWNPAGLVQLEGMQVVFFGTDVIPSGTYKLDLLGVDAATKSKHFISGAIGFFKPVTDKIMAGIYAYVPSGSGSHWDAAELAALTGGVAYNWETLVGIATISPAIAFKLSEKFSLGATINLNYGIVKMERPMAGQYEEDLSGMAFGASLGMLYKPTKKFSVGLNIKTPFKVKISGDTTMSGAPLYGLSSSDEGERDATWPMWVGLGFCFKPNDKLTFTADAQYTNWKKMTVIPMDFYSAGWTIFEEAASMELKWKDAVQLRFGTEYKVSDSLALRAGYYYDPSPSPKSTMTILLPEITYHFFTVGLGYRSKSIILDVGFEVALGEDRDLGLLEADPRAGMPGIHGNNVLVPNIALTILL